MQVVAMKEGFYGGARRRVGDVFNMTPQSKGGKEVLPSWVKVVMDPAKAKQEALAAKKAELDRQVEGAKAASGGKAAAAKVASAQDLAG